MSNNAGKRAHRMGLKVLAGASTTAMFTLGIAGVSQDAAGAVNFDRDGTRNMARAYWNSYPGFPYGSVGADCTNFVSFSWHLGGGVGQNNQWYMEQAWPPHQRRWSNSWTVAQTFYEYHTTSHWQNGQQFATYIPGNMSQQSPGAGTQYGDAIAYNFNEGTTSGVHHVAIDTNILWYGTWVDPTDGYPYVFNRGMTSIAQHTTNRLDAPWSLGYWQARIRDNDYARAAGMRAKTVHVNT